MKVHFIFHVTHHFTLQEDLRRNEQELTGEAETEKTELLTTDEACKAILWLTPGFKRANFSYIYFSTAGDLNFCVRGTPSPPPQSSPGGYEHYNGYNVDNLKGRKRARVLEEVKEGRRETVDIRVKRTLQVKH